MRMIRDPCIRLRQQPSPRYYHTPHDRHWALGLQGVQLLSRLKRGRRGHGTRERARDTCLATGASESSDAHVTVSHRVRKGSNRFSSHERAILALKAGGTIALPGARVGLPLRQ